MTTRFLKPAPGRHVDQLDGTPWPTDGMNAANTLFVRRRLKDGDLIEADRPVTASSPAIADPVTTSAKTTRKDT
ncbi:uncharacterized protein DUF2635 [Agrobacterium vitis]|nr:uncharacterized protein DUF2635 [Agrobacterium vitis]